jgi:hypothetical protein
LGSANGSIQELGAKLQSLESEASVSSLGGLGKFNAAFTATNRNAGDPICVEVCFGEGLIDARLVGAKALQEKGGQFERRACPLQWKLHLAGLEGDMTEGPRRR